MDFVLLSDSLRLSASWLCLVPGTAANLLACFYFIFLDPHRAQITHILLCLYSVCNMLLCLQTAPLAVSYFAPDSNTSSSWDSADSIPYNFNNPYHPDNSDDLTQFLPRSYCRLLLPLWGLTSHMATFFLVALALDLSSSLLYRTPLIARFKMAVITGTYLTLLLLLELIPLNFEDRVQYVVSRAGSCTWWFRLDLDVLNYRYLSGLVTEIIPVFIALISFFTLIWKLRKIRPYRQQLYYTTKTTVLLTIIFIGFHSVTFIKLLREAFLYYYNANKLDWNGGVYRYHDVSEQMLQALCALFSPVLLCVGIRDMRVRLCSCSGNRVAWSSV